MKKIGTCVSAALLALALTACGGGGDIYVEGRGRVDGGGSGVELEVSSQSVGVYPGERVNVKAFTDSYITSVRIYGVCPSGGIPLLLLDMRTPPFSGVVSAPTSCGCITFDLYAVATDEFGDQFTSPTTTVPLRR
jgi:hypothetical protein